MPTLSNERIERIAARRFAQTDAVRQYLRTALVQATRDEAMVAMTEFVAAERLNAATYRALMQGIALAYREVRS